MHALHALECGMRVWECGCLQKHAVARQRVTTQPQPLLKDAMHHVSFSALQWCEDASPVM
jgi:hypothetical protein